MAERGGVHPECINASNPFHECTDYCFRRIAEAKGRQQDDDEEAQRDCNTAAAAASSGPPPPTSPDREDAAQSAPEVDEAEREAEEERNREAYAHMNEKQRKLFDLRLKMNAARKANQAAIVAEKKRENAPEEVRGVSKKKWFEERQKRLGKVLDANGLDMTKAYMLDTQEQAEEKYEKWEKKPAPFGWDVFNQKSLYKAYKKRTKNIPYGMEDYMKAREADPDFYRDGSSLQYGKAPEIPEENIDKMVKEITERGGMRKEFSRRRKFHDEKDIDSINDRNEHFNRKIERAFGKYTVEIKNNLERGTALPD
ncbi:unnamed protein product [Calypogeia fissa]